MADPVTRSWPVEHVPDEHNLLKFVHRSDIEDGKVKPGAFRNRVRPNVEDGRPGMSTDWDKYSSPEQCRQRSRSPLDNAVISLSVGRVRAIKGQSVEHTPDPANRAHTDVFGFKSVREAATPQERIDAQEVRFMFTLIATVVLPLPESGLPD